MPARAARILARGGFPSGTQRTAGRVGFFTWHDRALRNGGNAARVWLDGFVRPVHIWGPTMHANALCVVKRRARDRLDLLGEGIFHTF